MLMMAKGGSVDELLLAVRGLIPVAVDRAPVREDLCGWVYVAFDVHDGVGREFAVAACMSASRINEDEARRRVSVETARKRVAVIGALCTTAQAVRLVSEIPATAPELIDWLRTPVARDQLRVLVVTEGTVLVELHPVAAPKIVSAHVPSGSN